MVSATALLASCASIYGTYPSTPDFLVQNAKDGKIITDKDIFEVKRPFAQVSEVLKNKAHECLRRGISFTSQGDSSGGVRLKQQNIRELTPKVIADKRRTRLTLQVKSTDGNTVNLAPPPPDGWYMMVVDVYPVDNHTTRVESYYQQTSFKGAFTAVKLWANGTNMNCPDLTQ